MWITRLENYIRYCFYTLFFLVPLIMHPATSELFELNKMWTVWGISLIILFLWIAKMIVSKKFVFQRTPLDIPIGLFLLSQLISTIFSMDQSVSWWGYYSRFNGGFLSLLTYAFLYYAFASNVLNSSRRHLYKVILGIFISGIVVALWGFPSHFGYDPTCLVFRGSLDVSCWTSSFQPKVRIFSTLGQPNWMAAFLAVVLPIGLAYALKFLAQYRDGKNMSALLKCILSLLAVLLFYLDLIWTDSQSGFLGLWAGLAVFAGIFAVQLVLKSRPDKTFRFTIAFIGGLFLTLLIINFLVGIPIRRFQDFTLSGLTRNDTSAQQTKAAENAAPAGPALEYGGTDSSKIRLIVWRGAIDIFKAHPLFGSGVETYAYAYYKHRPASHNLTSEWDYLYNKAHNEYLNYLATTGAFGLGTYLLFIGWFYYLLFKSLKQTEHPWYIPAALAGGFTSILVSNFFGFSVVIMNIFLFMLPLFYLHLAYPQFRVSESEHPETSKSGPMGVTGIACIGLVILILEFVLFRYWQADKAYGLGNNLDKAGEYVQANPYLIQAVQMRPREDLFKDELSVNLSTLALAYAQNQQATMAAQLGQQAQLLSDTVVQNHPNNVVYWKSRTRVLYALAQLDPTLFSKSLEAIERAHELAPTDAKIMYNLALLYQQAGEQEKAIQLLDQTTKLKPNYRDAYYAKAVILSDLATSMSATNSAAAAEKNAQARTTLEFILKNIEPKDQQVQDLLKKVQ